MKHNAFTALSMAAALVVAGSAGATEFSMNFETGTALPSGEGTWTVPTGDASAVVAVPDGAPDKCGEQSLQLDTGDAELTYTPISTDVSILELDVCFVGADTPPDATDFDGKTMVYLDVTDESVPVLKAWANGTWNTLNPSGVTISNGGWYKLRMEFDGNTVTYKVNDIAAGSVQLTSGTFGKVESVGFKGTGLIDNFVGDKGGISGYTDDGTGENAGNAVAFENGVVTGSFETTALKFIRVYNGNNYVTLRYTDSQAITLPANFGTPTKVVAYYGDGVSATTGITPEATDVAVDNGTVTVTFTAKSGVYYWLKDVSDNSSLAGTATAIAPNAEGVITLTFDADSHAWGVKKFQLVVDDNPPPAAAGN